MGQALKIIFSQLHWQFHFKRPIKNKAVQHFPDLIKNSRNGKFKIYVDMNEGVGKTHRWLQEAITLQKNGESALNKNKIIFV